LAIVGDEALPGLTYTPVAAQGLGREPAEDMEKHLVCGAVHYVLLVGASI